MGGNPEHGAGDARGAGLGNSGNKKEKPGRKCRNALKRRRGSYAVSIAARLRHSLCFRICSEWIGMAETSDRQELCRFMFGASCDSNTVQPVQLAALLPAAGYCLNLFVFFSFKRICISCARRVSPLFSPIVIPLASLFSGPCGVQSSPHSDNPPQSPYHGRRAFRRQIFSIRY